MSLYPCCAMPKLDACSGRGMGRDSEMHKSDRYVPTTYCLSISLVVPTYLSGLYTEYTRYTDTSKGTVTTISIIHTHQSSTQSHAVQSIYHIDEGNQLLAIANA